MNENTKSPVSHSSIVTIPLHLSDLSAHVLRRECESVPLTDIQALEHCREISTEMYFVMLETDGVAIAAPQIGCCWRIVVINENQKLPFSPLVLLNPEIVEHSETRNVASEGCLSLPCWSAEVPRYDSVVVEYYSIEGKKERIEAEGYAARVLQHEIDHLSGKLYIDRVENRKGITFGEPTRLKRAQRIIGSLFSQEAETRERLKS